MNRSLDEVSHTKVLDSAVNCLVPRSLKIGTSGFGVNKSEYSRHFDCVEIQNTFYQPPRISTLTRWREAMPPAFEFVVKAWQLITHDAKSPTYRRLKRKLTDLEKREAGYFRPTTIVREAWDVTCASARALEARTILFQCPASFEPTRENVSHLTEFFSEIARERFRMAWEPRGEWKSDLIASLCHDLELWHVVDPFKSRTVTPDRCYFRLHGKNGWRYEYDDNELEELSSLMRGDHLSYVFFNNSKMTQDAHRFCEMIGKG